MRTEKFNPSKHGDDINYAFECNGLSARLLDIDVIVAEVCGENDGYPWYWILQMKDGTFSYATGWCDCTGWDCQSGAEINDGFKTPEAAVEHGVLEDTRKVKEVLLKQIKGELPFALYQE